MLIVIGNEQLQFLCSEQEEKDKNEVFDFMCSVFVLKVTAGFTVFINTRAINSVLFCSATHDTSQEGHTATPLSSTLHRSMLICQICIISVSHLLG